MDILPYHIESTNDLLTSRAGLLPAAHMMQSIGLGDWANEFFPAPGSNRGFKPAIFVNTLVLSLLEGGHCLEDLHHIREDVALCKLLGLTHVPTADALGDWLRRMGDKGVLAMREVNRKLLSVSLRDHKAVTLDMDATLSASKNHSAKWTYKKCKGYMPMVGHIAKTGQILAMEFREGNVPPAADNFDFLKKCEEALPEDVSLSAVRIDSAGYQVSIIDRCIDQGWKFAIRAKMNTSLKKQIQALHESQWQSMQDRNGDSIEDESTTRLVHTMEKSKHAFTLIVQRKRKTGQVSLELEEETDHTDTLESNGYIYRAIAVSNDEVQSNSDWVHWYNQRGEHSENRIKELKNDFAAGNMPCQDFSANALYFSLCGLAYNVFALMRSHLPEDMQKHRAKTLRLRLFAIAGKVVRHSRKLYLKLRIDHCELLKKTINSMRPLLQALS